MVHAHVERNVQFVTLWTHQISLAHLVGEMYKTKGSINYNSRDVIYGINCDNLI